MNSRPQTTPKSEVDILDDPARYRRTAMVSGEMDITPMIDITFLLLIFFLVSTRLDPSGEVELPAAQTGSSVSEKTSVIISIRTDRDHSARIVKGDARGGGGTELMASDPRGQEQELINYIQEQINRPTMSPTVLVKAAKNVRQRDIMRVATAVGQVPEVQLHFAVLEIP